MSSGKFISFYEQKNLSDDYYIYRPTYPQSVAEEIVQEMKKSSSLEKFDFMLDVGCGSGQATQIFAPYFKSIMGIDISAEQLEVANQRNKCQNISFRQVRDNNLPADDNSVDYINCATTAHWLDLNHFVSECRRVLKPGGLAALYIYIPSSVQTEPCEELVHQEVLDVKFHTLMSNFVKSFNGHSRNDHWLQGYRTIFEGIENPTKRWLPLTPLVIHWKLLDWRNFWMSKGDYVKFMRDENPETDPLGVFMNNMKQLLMVNGKEENNVSIKMTWKIPTIVFGKEKEDKFS